MRLFAQSLFYGGLLLTLISAAKLPESKGIWPDTWPIFLLGFCLAVSGILLKCNSMNPQVLHSLERQLVGPNLLLTDLLTALINLQTEVFRCPLVDIGRQIEQYQNDYLFKINSQNQLILECMGTQIGTHILLHLAQGERLLNRAYSAASDQHREETALALSQAIAALQQASDNYLLYNNGLVTQGRHQPHNEPN